MIFASQFWLILFFGPTSSRFFQLILIKVFFIDIDQDCLVYVNHNYLD